MINVNSNSHIQSGIQAQQQYNSLSTVAQDVTPAPLQLQNDNVQLQQDRPSDKDNSHFSHNRHTALKAYLELNGEAETDSSERTRGTSAPDSSEVSKTEDGPEDESAEAKGSSESAKKSNDRRELTEDEKAQVESMKKRDTEVRIHENAHKAVGGHLASAPSYEYETGPDGKRYITDGHVNIDVSEEKDPKATIEKMQKVRAAALAPAQPSSADRSVAADAQQKENAARAKMREQAQEEQNAKSTAASDNGDDSESIKGNEKSGKSDKSDDNNVSERENSTPAVISKKLEGDMGV